MAEKSNELKEVKDSVDQIANTNKEICKVLLDLLDHEITGNHAEQLKKTRHELEAFIIGIDK